MVQAPTACSRGSINTLKVVSSSILKTRHSRPINAYKACRQDTPSAYLWIVLHLRFGITVLKPPHVANEQDATNMYQNGAAQVRSPPSPLYSVVDTPRKTVRQ